MHTVIAHTTISTTTPIVTTIHITTPITRSFMTNLTIATDVR